MRADMRLKLGPYRGKRLEHPSHAAATSCVGMIRNPDSMVTPRARGASRLRTHRIVKDGYPAIGGRGRLCPVNVTLPRRERRSINMKRVRRLYRLESLQLRHRLCRRKHMSLRRGIPPKASRAQERWSMDFVHDLLIDGRASRVLTVVDQWSRWSPILEVGSSMTGQAVAEALGRVIPQMAFPPRSPWIMAPSSPRMHWMSGRIGVA